LELESLQRWIACDRDERVGAVLDEVGEHLRDGPAALKQLILMRSVAPEIDAAVRAQGFAGGNEWAGATMQVVGALLEAGIGLKLDALDQNAVEYTPEEFAKLLNEQYMSLADLHLAFGARPVEDIGLAGKYRESIFKALGGAAGATGEQT
ncbi:MAG TPA: hypothetical protein QGH10_05535, partial [Armatimonadota bacterium]|nr:hypothetical protein [Armatimonadota bacterium]